VFLLFAFLHFGDALRRFSSRVSPVKGRAPTILDSRMMLLSHALTHACEVLHKQIFNFIKFSCEPEWKLSVSPAATQPVLLSVAERCSFTDKNLSIDSSHVTLGTPVNGRGPLSVIPEHVRSTPVRAFSCRASGLNREALIGFKFTLSQFTPQEKREGGMQCV
jgi:hypothetical protein